MRIIWIVILATALAALQAVVFKKSNMRRLSYSRRFSRAWAYEGGQVELIEVIRNVKFMPVPWLRAESRISPNLRFGKEAVGEDRAITGNRYHRSVFFMAPYSQITRKHRVTCLKRGYYKVGSVALTAGDLLGIAEQEQQLSLPCEIDVYPRLLSDEELDTPSTRWQGELAVRRWIMPDPFLTSGVRDYRAGDPQRDIHWRATARMGQLQVKVRDYTADPRALVILNVQGSETQWGDLMDYEQEIIEHGIRTAATLCMRALDAGVEAGFASNGCPAGEKNSGKTIYVPAHSGSEQKEEILTAMARMEIHREMNFTTFLETFSNVSGIDMLVLSVYDSEEIQRRIAALRRAGNTVTLVKLEKGGKQ